MKSSLTPYHTNLYEDADFSESPSRSLYIQRMLAIHNKLKHSNDVYIQTVTDHQVPFSVKSQMNHNNHYATTELSPVVNSNFQNYGMAPLPASALHSSDATSQHQEMNLHDLVISTMIKLESVLPNPQYWVLGVLLLSTIANSYFESLKYIFRHVGNMYLGDGQQLTSNPIFISIFLTAVWLIYQDVFTIRIKM